MLEDRDEIPLVGVASIDGDSARSWSCPTRKTVASGQQVLRHWRWQVDLVKVDGEWLVDDFEEID